MSLPEVVTSTPTITWLGQSALYWTLYAGRKPPSAIFITVASGSVLRGPRLVLLVGLLLGLHLRQPRQGLPQPLVALAGGTLAGRGLAPRRGGGVVVEFLLEPLDLFLGFVQVFLQGGLGGGRRRPRRWRGRACRPGRRG